MEQQWSICQPRFLVKNAEGEAMMSIEGPSIVCDCCSDIDFNIMSLVNQSEVRRNIVIIISDTVLYRSGKSPSSGQESGGKCLRMHKTSASLSPLILM